MFNYTLKEQGIDIVDTVLSNRSLTMKDANLIMNATFEDYNLEVSDLKNVDKAAKMLNNALDKCFKIGILIDSDCDGYCSSAMMFHYLTETIGYKNVVYKFHDKPKAHGIQDYVIEWGKEEKIELLIVPDAGCGSSDELGQKTLSDLGMNILILDHHIPEYIPCETVVIVNPHQEGDTYLNKYLSGAGVTHKFIEYHSNELGLEYLYSDLFALSLVSDMMNLRDSVENRAYLNFGSIMVKSPFILEAVGTRLDKNEKLAINDFAFSIAPLINATVRFGNDEERNIVFRSLFSEELVLSKKRGMVGKQVPIAVEAFRIAGNLKRKQDKARDKGVEVLSETIEDLGFEENKVITLIVDDILEPSISGLVANKLVNKYNRPIMLLRTVDDCTLGGSVRTVNDNNDLKKFKSICLSTGLFEFCSGHEGSFGVGLYSRNLQHLGNKFNEILKDVEFNTSYELDGIYDGKIPFSDIKDIANLKDLWCFDIKEPLFLVRNIKLNTDDIKKIGNATYTFKFNKTIFTKFFGSKVWFSNFILEDELPFGGNINVDIICKFKEHNGTYIAEIVDAISSIVEEFDNEYRYDF